MNSNLGTSAEHGSDAARRKPRILKVAMALGIAFVNVRSAVLVIALTYASTGRGGVLYLLSWSLAYFGIREAIAQWGRTGKGTTPGWLYLIDGAPDFLLLGIMALIVHVSFEHSDAEGSAYLLRILLIVATLFSLRSLSEDLSRLIRARRGTRVDGRRLDGEIGLDAIGVNQASVDGWVTMSPFERLLLVVSHALNSALWTWLVIYYRYFRDSFLRQSSWVMVALWIFVASCWLGFVAVFFGAYQSSKESANGLRGIE
jgi:hypothetical protein